MKKKNNNKNIKHKNNYLLTNLTSEKQNKKTKQENYQKQNQHRNRNAETYTMTTKTITTTEKEPAKNESNQGLKRRMLGKFVSKKQANIRKGKGKKRKIKETQNNNVFEKRGWWTKNKETMEFWKGRQKGKPKNNRIGRKEGF